MTTRLAIAIERAIHTEKEASRLSQRDNLGTVIDIESAAEAYDAKQQVLTEFRMMGVTEEALKAFTQII